MDPQTPPLSPPRWYERRALLGAAVGLGYTLPMRLLFTGVFRTTEVGPQVLGAMSVAFLCCVPAATGALTVHLAGRRGPVTLRQALTIPWVACATAVLAALAAVLEGTICIVLAAPLFFAMGSLGGLVMALLERRRRRQGPAVVAALLPLAWGGVEGRVEGPRAVIRVENVAVVAAPPAVVWRHVASVEAIAPAELPWSFSHAIGLPRPIEATLDAQGVGGVRRATFERGLVFAERVTGWAPERAIEFAIVAEHAPAEALDEHVVVGGRYFDVVDGGYALEDLGDGRTRVTLSSTHHLTTTLNGYAGLWSRAVMWDLQRVILHVIAARSEADARAGR